MHRALLLLALLAPLCAQPGRFGLPSCSGPDRELAVKHSFVICHSASFKAPLWTAHEPRPSLSASPILRMHFRGDRSLSMPGASDSDCRNSGFSRGHLVPAGDVAGDELALRDSFLLSNAVPQNPAMNLSSWRRLENFVRRLSDQAGSAIVITGAVFEDNPRTIGPGRVAVPGQLYKVVLVSQGSKIRKLAALMPNAEINDRALESFFVTVDEIERLTGLKFFSELSVSSATRGQELARLSGEFPGLGCGR